MKENSVITLYRDSNKTINLDNYKNSKIYNGNTPKFGVTLNGIDYIVKLNKTEKDVSALCEYVASHFINEIGFKAHKTLLQKYNNETVVLLKDFTSKNNTLRTFRNTSESYEDTYITTYTYEDVADVIIRHTKFSDKLKKTSINTILGNVFL